MKRFLLLLLCGLSVEARAAKMGDSYDQVIAEKGAPKSKMGAGANLILNYEDAMIKLRDGKVVSISAIQPPPPKPTTPAGEVALPKPTLASLKATELRAINRVKEIVNQPAPTVTPPPGARVGHYPGWFHDGASMPDFANVDLRQTQESPYDKFEFVASSQNPGPVYLGKSLEFNSATKIFYVDRSVPKKRLTEREMVELNALYRIIAESEGQLHLIQAP